MLSSLDIPPFLLLLLSSPPSAGGIFVADHARILSVLRESPLLLRTALAQWLVDPSVTLMVVFLTREKEQLNF